MADHYPGIPAIDGAIPREIRSVLGPMREILRLFTDPLNPAVRAGMLAEAGLIDGYSAQGGIVPTPGYDGTPPPAPTGLTAGGGLANVILSWDAAPSDSIAHAEIWRAETDSIALAQKIGTAPGQVYADAIGTGATRYYWIRYVSLTNNPGPFNAQTGTPGTTGHDASYLLDVLAANPPAGASYNPLLYVQSAAIVIDGVTVPAGVYMASAYIRALSVTNAQIANLAVDNAKVANLDAVKITTGYLDAARIAVGSLDAKLANINAAVIGSGFINMARIQDAAITAAKIMDGEVTNAKIGNHIKSTNYNGTIDGNGNITANGTLGWAIGKGGKAVFQDIVARGDIQATSLNVTNGGTGARLEATGNAIKVYDSAGVLRVQLGVF